MHPCFALGRFNSLKIQDCANASTTKDYTPSCWNCGPNGAAVARRDQVVGLQLRCPSSRRIASAARNSLASRPTPTVASSSRPWLARTCCSRIFCMGTPSQGAGPIPSGSNHNGRACSSLRLNDADSVDRKCSTTCGGHPRIRTHAPNGGTHPKEREGLHK